MHTLHFFYWLISAVFAGSITACSLMSAKKEPRSNNQSGINGLYRYLQKDSIKMARMDDLTSARLTFSTLVTANCRIVYFPQKSAAKERPNNQKTMACSNAGETTFEEQIDTLEPATRYTVMLYVWPTGTTEASGDVATVDEPPLSSSGGRKLDELFVARLNVPLREAEVHRHQLDEATTLKTIESDLTAALGCHQGEAPAASAFSTTAGESKLTQLETRDFATARAQRHPDYPQRWRLSYPALSTRVKTWTINYILDDKQIEVSTKPISLFKDLEMESETTLKFDPPQILDATDFLKIDASKPLKFSWTAIDVSETAHVQLLIGRTGRDDAIACFFKASALHGEIAPKMLASLATGKHVVLTELVDYQLFGDSGWLVQTVDWRSSRIEKQ